jgi:hypothetical protein
LRQLKIYSCKSFIEEAAAAWATHTKDNLFSFAGKEVYLGSGKC